MLLVVVPTCRRSARGCPPPPPALTPVDMRGRTPLGQDADGNSYHWYDMPYDHDAPVGLMGSRLYVEGPPRQPDAIQQQQQQQGQDSQQQQQREIVEQQQHEGKGLAVKQEGGGGDGQGVGGGDAAAAAGSGKPPLPPTR